MWKYIPVNIKIRNHSRLFNDCLSQLPADTQVDKTATLETVYYHFLPTLSNQIYAISKEILDADIGA